MQDAPLEFQYKADIVALLAECLIKAIEARTLQHARTPPPVKPKGVQARSVRRAVRRRSWPRTTASTNSSAKSSSGIDERQGWTMTEYFFGKLQAMEHEGDGLRDEIGPMIYGMDVSREQGRDDDQIVFAKTGSERRAERRRLGKDAPAARAQLTWTALKMALLKGDRSHRRRARHQSHGRPQGRPWPRALRAGTH